MRRYFHVLLLLAQLLIVVPLAFFLGSKLDLRDEVSALRRKSLSAFGVGVVPEDTDVESVDGGSLDHAMTVEVPNEVTQKQMAVQMITPFIPVGPDETPPQMHADIPTDFPIEEADYCLKRPNLDIIAYVHSAIKDPKDRDITRRTWANASAYGLGVNVGVVFMVGRPKNDLERAILKEESNKYHDIVQGNYGDHYRLLSYKGLASIYWINKHCSHVPWTLHTDDDLHLDIFLYYKMLKEFPLDIQEKFICSHMYGPALRFGRWYVSFEQYPSINYLLYCSGGAWFLQTKFLPKLLRASKVVPFLWVDDAYLTGLLAREAGLKQHGFQKSYGHPKPELDQVEIGQKVAWFYLHQNRLDVWDRIVAYHKNAALRNV